jgi:DNA-binding NarL/FixJ family response regulator
MSSEINPIRVVLADDHNAVRAGIRMFLESVPDIRVVAEADNGEMAQALIQQHQPDVAVLDIQMPKGSGIDVTRWVRASRQPVGVLILTAYDDDAYVLGVLQAGANGYVLKTASPLEVICAVREVAEGRSALGATIAQKLMVLISGHGPVQHEEYEQLTEREIEVLTLASKGDTNKAIGVQLGISDRTVQGHLANIYGKLNANSRTEAVMRAVSLGLIPNHIQQ